MFEQRPVII